MALVFGEEGAQIWAEESQPHTDRSSSYLMMVPVPLEGGCCHSNRCSLGGMLSASNGVEGGRGNGMRRSSKGGSLRAFLTPRQPAHTDEPYISSAVDGYVKANELKTVAITHNSEQQPQPLSTVTTSSILSRASKGQLIKSPYETCMLIFSASSKDNPSDKAMSLIAARREKMRCDEKQKEEENRRKHEGGSSLVSTVHQQGGARVGQGSLYLKRHTGGLLIVVVLNLTLMYQAFQEYLYHFSA
ncbi:hypothetical protein DPX16_17474 [Anabarilius grahami]|uniref:Uncharacterized protein n=1 Tax=Anabarilius grahami TaxID=495550 RepID=A0A3N0XZD2_ANAGA|nr:hypothetical protein DPX16_17474 [Anabarilius grahami]